MSRRGFLVALSPIVVLLGCTFEPVTGARESTPVSKGPTATASLVATPTARPTFVTSTPAVALSLSIPPTSTPIPTFTRVPTPIPPPTPAPTPTPTPTPISLPAPIKASELTQDQVWKWGDWLAALSEPPDGAMLTMQYRMFDSLPSCDRHPTALEEAEARAALDAFGLIYTYEWEPNSPAMLDVEFWAKVYDPNLPDISPLEWGKIRSLVGTFMWTIEYSMFELIEVFGATGCDDTVAIFEELLYPAYDDLPTLN